MSRISQYRLARSYCDRIISHFSPNRSRSRKIKDILSTREAITLFMTVVAAQFVVPSPSLFYVFLALAISPLFVVVHVTSVLYRNVIGNHVVRRQHIVTFEPHSTKERFAPVLFVRLLMSMCNLATLYNYSQD